MAPPPPPPTPQQQLGLGPSDIAGLFACLKGALEPASQKQAEAALKSLEARPGFCSCLTVSSVSLSPSLVVTADYHRCLPAPIYGDSRTLDTPSPDSMQHIISQEIVGAVDADHSARWLACTELKNCIAKNWRPRLDGSCASARAPAPALAARHTPKPRSQTSR